MHLFVFFATTASHMTLLLWSPGQKVWALYGYDIEKGYPKSLSIMGLPETVKKVSAVLSDPDTGKTLFFVGEYYYR